MPKPIDIRPMDLLALVVCDDIREDGEPKRQSLIGLRDEFVADEYPFKMEGGYIYLGYTGVRQGQIDMLIRLVDADDGSRIRYAEFTVTGVTAVGNGSATVPLDGANVPRSGTYFAEAIANGHLIGRRRIEFRLRGETDGKAG